MYILFRNDVTASTNELKGAYAHLATKEDVAKLAGTLTWRMVIVAGVAQAIGIGALIGSLKFLP